MLMHINIECTIKCKSNTMGVRLLQTYIERYVKNGVHNVDIRKEVDEFKRTHDGAEPLIVIDLLSTHPLFYTNHELMLGGRYRVFGERATNLFRAIKSLGVRLVFFTDAPTRQEKIPKSLMRRNDNYQKSLQALKIVYSGVDLSTNLGSIEVPSPVPFFSALKKIARQFGEVYVAVLNECNAELADYATTNNAFAIMSNDSDYLIFEGNWRYWSSRKLDVLSLCTVEFNREALQRNLGLRSNEMALLATMSGNGIIPYDSLQNYRNQGRQHGGLHFQAVADQIHSLRLNPESISDEQANMIAKLIFGGTKHQSNVDLVKLSLKSYKYSELIRDHKSEILSLTSQSNGKLNYILLADIEYIVQLYHFDLSKNDLKPYFHIISPLFQRIMGVLLKNEVKPVTRIFYSKLSHMKNYEKITLTPEYPPIEIPALKDLLFCEIGKNPSLDETRLDLMCWLISSKLKPEIIKSLPVENAANAITLLYLVELEQITIDEADYLLLACNCPINVQNSLNLGDVKKINERDCRIAFLFTSVQLRIKNCFYAVGWKEFCQLITFDGLYFHHLRQTRNTSLSASLSDYESLRIYAT